MARYAFVFHPEEYYWHLRIAKWHERKPFAEQGQNDYLIYIKSSPSDSLETLTEQIRETKVVFLTLGQYEYDPSWLQDLVNLVEANGCFMFCVKIPELQVEKPEEMINYKMISLNPNALSKYIQLANKKVEAKNKEISR